MGSPPCVCRAAFLLAIYFGNARPSCRNMSPQIWGNSNLITRARARAMRPAIGPPKIAFFNHPWAFELTSGAAGWPVTAPCPLASGDPCCIPHDTCTGRSGGGPSACTPCRAWFSLRTAAPGGRQGRAATGAAGRGTQQPPKLHDEPPHLRGRPGSGASRREPYSSPKPSMPGTSSSSPSPGAKIGVLSWRWARPSAGLPTA